MRFDVAMAKGTAMSNARVLDGCDAGTQNLLHQWHRGSDHRWHDGRVSQGTTADLIATMERLRGVNSNGA